MAACTGSDDSAGAGDFADIAGQRQIGVGGNEKGAPPDCQGRVAQLRVSQAAVQADHHDIGVAEVSGDGDMALGQSVIDAFFAHHEHAAIRLLVGQHRRGDLGRVDNLSRFCRDPHLDEPPGYFGRWCRGVVGHEHERHADVPQGSHKFRGAGDHFGAPVYYAVHVEEKALQPP